MEWQIIVVLIVATPIILFPVAFIWYINIGGIVHYIRERAEAREAAAQTAEG